MSAADKKERRDALRKGSSDRAGARMRRALGLLFGAHALGDVSKATTSSPGQLSTFHAFAFTIDHGLIAAGVAAAVGSAGFAGFMLSRDNSHPMFGGIEHLMIFAQPIGGVRTAAPSDAGGERRSPIDYHTTGSIEHETTVDSQARAASREESARPKDELLKAYVLRFDRKGGPAIEGLGRLYAATPGAAVPGVGRVLSLENRNGRWYVKTEGGVITEADR